MPEQPVCRRLLAMITVNRRVLLRAEGLVGVHRAIGMRMTHVGEVDVAMAGMSGGKVGPLTGRDVGSRQVNKDRPGKSQQRRYGGEDRAEDEAEKKYGFHGQYPAPSVCRSIACRSNFPQIRVEPQTTTTPIAYARWIPGSRSRRCASSAYRR